MAAAAATLILQGCGGTKVIPPEEVQARLKSTLNVYEDNQVWFRSGGNVSWTNDPKDIFALEIEGKIYNTKDINKIEIVEKTSEIVVLLKSGERIVARNYFNDSKREWDVMWHICNARKECEVGGNFYRGHPNGPIGKYLTSVYESNFSRTPERDPAGDIIKDSRSIPTNSNVQFLTRADGEAVDQKIAALSERWAKIVHDRQQKQAEIRQATQEQERRIEAEAIKVRANLRVGSQTNCGQVFEIRSPMAGVQTIVGMQFIDVSRLYGPSANCRFVNGQYVGR